MVWTAVIFGSGLTAQISMFTNVFKILKEKNAETLKTVSLQEYLISFHSNYKSQLDKRAPG